MNILQANNIPKQYELLTSPDCLCCHGAKLHDVLTAHLTCVQIASRMQNLTDPSILAYVFPIILTKVDSLSDHVRSIIIIIIIILYQIMC